VVAGLRKSCRINLDRILAENLHIGKYEGKNNQSTNSVASKEKTQTPMLWVWRVGGCQAPYERFQLHFPHVSSYFTVFLKASGSLFNSFVAFVRHFVVIISKEAVFNFILVIPILIDEIINLRLILTYVWMLFLGEKNGDRERSKNLIENPKKFLVVIV
jgi:hypothetical protein